MSRSLGEKSEFERKNRMERLELATYLATKDEDRANARAASTTDGIPP
jgi:hypothetical protein